MKIFGGAEMQMSLKKELRKFVTVYLWGLTV